MDWADIDQILTLTRITAAVSVFTTIVVSVGLYLTVFSGLRKRQAWARTLGRVCAIAGNLGLLTTIVMTVVLLSYFPIVVSAVFILTALFSIVVNSVWLLVSFSSEITAWLRQPQRPAPPQVPPPPPVAPPLPPQQDISPRNSPRQYPGDWSSSS